MLYKTGKVYRIICLPEPDIQYIGSTFNTLRHRFTTHKSVYKRWLNGIIKKCVSIFPYFKKYGVKNFKIVLIKEYLVCAKNNKDHKHLSVYEQLWINKTTNVNKKSCFSIKWLQKLKKKKYYEEHKEELNEVTKQRGKKYREEHKEEKKKYREEHKEEQKKYDKKYREEHKKKLNKIKNKKLLVNVGW